MVLSNLKKWVTNPWVILGSLAGGLVLGSYAPQFSLNLAIIGQIYLDLMKMIVLPFMMSAVILSVQRLIHQGGSGQIMGRLVIVFAGFLIAAAVVGAGTMLITQPGSNLPQETMETFGDIVGRNTESNNTAMELNGPDVTTPKAGIKEMFLSLVPSNIFSALVKDDTLKVLVFSLLLGFAIGHVPANVSGGFAKSLETLYQACQKLMQWMNYVLPLVLLCMSAGQLAKTGLEPLLAMMQFVMALSVASGVLLLLAVWGLWHRSGASLGQVLIALRDPFVMAIATRNSVICIPSMMESLVDRLGFNRAQVELLVPLSVSLLRLGPVVYYVTATLFIAQLYGLNITPGQLGLVMTASILAGFASAGMTGLAIVSLIGITCGYLGLPFEAAFVLFLAIDPISDILRTLVLVISNMTSVALISARPQRQQVTEITSCAAS